MRQVLAVSLSLAVLGALAFPQAACATRVGPATAAQGVPGAAGAWTTPRDAEPIAGRPSAPPQADPAGAVGTTRLTTPEAAARVVLEPAYVPRVALRLRSEVRVGPLTGWLQTPKGGQPGTTTLERPTFEELGADTLVAPTADLRAAFGRHRIHAGASLWILHGSATLEEDLVSHDDAYPAGTAMTCDTEILAHWIGYGYTLDLSGGRGRMVLTPGLGLYGYGQRYAISGGANDSSRDFTSYSPMMDAELAWDAGGRVRLSLSLMLVADEALGLSSPTNAVDAVVRLHYDLARRASLHLAVGWSSLEHYDEQQVPNHSDMQAPWAGVGLDWRF